MLRIDRVVSCERKERQQCQTHEENRNNFHSFFFQSKAEKMKILGYIQKCSIKTSNSRGLRILNYKKWAMIFLETNSAFIIDKVHQEHHSSNHFNSRTSSK